MAPINTLTSADQRNHSGTVDARSISAQLAELKWEIANLRFQIQNESQRIDEKIDLIGVRLVAQLNVLKWLLGVFVIGSLCLFILLYRPS